MYDRKRSRARSRDARGLRRCMGRRSSRRPAPRHCSSPDPSRPWRSVRYPPRGKTLSDLALDQVSVYELCVDTRLGPPGELDLRTGAPKRRARRTGVEAIPRKNRAAPWESFLRHEETRRGLPRLLLPVGDRGDPSAKLDLGDACERECDCEDEPDGDDQAEAPEDTEVEVQIHDALVRRLERAIRFEERHRGLRSVVDFELPINRRQVELHGVDSDAQPPGDLPICHALCHQLHHLRFPRRERVRPDGLLGTRYEGSSCLVWSIYGTNEQKPSAA